MSIWYSDYRQAHEYYDESVEDETEEDIVVLNVGKGIIDKKSRGISPGTIHNKEEK